MEIFIINLDSASNIETKLLDSFRQKNISDEKYKRAHSFSYLMLNRILKDVYGINNSEIEFVNKKPFLKNRKKYFSISHSKEYVVIAISDSDCGVDIEQIKKRDYKSISKRMGFAIESLEFFYRNWTKYEAEYKLGGNSQKHDYAIIADYMLCAVSQNSLEKFEIYIQS